MEIFLESGYQEASMRKIAAKAGITAGAIYKHFSGKEEMFDELFEASEPGGYAAIIMDIHMPIMDGMEATRIIRGLPRDDARSVPIIALTANSIEYDAKTTASVGMNAHLSKPADTAELIRTLERLV